MFVVSRQPASQPTPKSFAYSAYVFSFGGCNKKKNTFTAGKRYHRSVYPRIERRVPVEKEHECVGPCEIRARRGVGRVGPPHCSVSEFNHSLQPVGWHLYFRRGRVPWDVRGRESRRRCHRHNFRPLLIRRTCVPVGRLSRSTSRCAAPVVRSRRRKESAGNVTSPSFRSSRFSDDTSRSVRSPETPIPER